jgi:hypothetical protein
MQDKKKYAKHQVTLVVDHQHAAETQLILMNTS